VWSIPRFFRTWLPAHINAATMMPAERAERGHPRRISKTKQMSPKAGGIQVSIIIKNI
jgi:hypothetical protein